MESGMEFRKSLHFAIKCTFHFQTDRSLAKEKGTLLSKAVLKTVLLYVMAIGYIAAGINHFWHPRFYLRIMPPYLAAPHLLNYASGIIEILLGVLLLVKTTRPFAAWGIAAMLLVFRVVDIYILQPAPPQPNYFISVPQGWRRVALQPVLIVWALGYTKP